MRTSASVLILLGALQIACEGDGSDVGPRIPELSTRDYLVLVRDDGGRPVSGARVTVAGVGAAATNRRGRARLRPVPSGVRRITVDGVAGTAAEGDDLAALTFEAVTPDGLELPRAVHLPDLAPSAGLTLPTGLSGGATLDDGATSGAVVTVPAGTVVSNVAQTGVTLRTGVLQPGHLPLELPEPSSGAGLWSRGIFLGPLTVSFQPGVSLAIPNDLGLPMGGTASVWYLDPSTGIWTRTGSARLDSSGRLASDVGTIPAGGLYAFRTEVAPTTMLSGRVVDRAGAPISGALVRGDSRWARALGDGTWALPPIAAVDAGGSARTVTVEVHGGRGWLPNDGASGPLALAPGPQGAGDVILDSVPAAIVRLQLLRRGAPVARERVPVGDSRGLTFGAGLTDALGRIDMEDQASGAFAGLLTSSIADHDSVWVTRRVLQLPAGAHHRDLQVFSALGNFADPLGSARLTQVHVVDGLSTSPMSGARVLAGRMPGIVVATTPSNGIVVGDFAFGQATAIVESSAGVTTVTSAFSMQRVATRRIELPLERARLPRGPWPRHGLLRGSLLQTGAGDDWRVRGTRVLTPTDWYDGTFDVLPVEDDPATNGGTTYALGVPAPRGHVAAVELRLGAGGLEVQRVGLAPYVTPAPGGIVDRDLPLDMVADTDFVIPGAGAMPTEFDLAAELADGTVVDVVRRVPGGITLQGQDVVLRLPALDGVLAGGRWLVRLVKATSCAPLSGTPCPNEVLVVGLDGSPRPAAPFVQPPTLLAPPGGAPLAVAGFTVQWVPPADAHYTLVRLRSKDPAAVRDWTALLPPQVTSFDFRQLPAPVPQILVAGESYTLSVTFVRLGPGVVGSAPDSLLRVQQHLVGISRAERGVEAWSSTTIDDLTVQ